MIKVSQLCDLIIKPALLDLQLFSEPAMQLLVFTCAAESNGGDYLKQINGPALGIYQMEPEDYNDIWQNYIKGHRGLLLMLISNFGTGVMPPEDRLIYDIRFATAMARIHYARVPQELPVWNDEEGLWEYYKQYYNTSLGLADKDRCITSYQNFLKT